MKLGVLFFYLLHVQTSASVQALNYEFQYEDGQPKLEVKKHEKPGEPQMQTTALIPGTTATSKVMSDKDILRQAPMMAPMVELGDMVRDFSAMLNQKKQKKKTLGKRKTQNKRKLKSKKPVAKEKETFSWDLKPKHPKKMQKKKKRRLFGLGEGLAVAGVAAGGVAMAGMAMGAASNEKLEKDLQMKENMFGILVIRTKVDEELNNDLFTAWMKFKNLREKGKDLIKNGLNQLRVAEESVDHMLGDLQAMDNNMASHLGL